ncbi:multiheme c-type cytochrome [Maridesulfovibrio bastinii]|uniref:multiheme c-type cytochrome n=1 Tax=Maridesulfovibrio bastinii TaxID=47157 RepID=UPI000402683D|nr:cytochrome ubiquinol oxidase subunit I [Maridesulfovibrio bastinii]
MEYPIWHLTALGGGFWIALIATVHVFVAQFAVGGGLFLVVSERQAYKSGSEELLEYVRKHSKFFLLLTMVFGGVTGVAIWFIISLLSPQGTLTLIRQFVFAWASEWVCFAGEIVALLVYFYSWKKMDRRDHMRVGWLYFAFAWMSLFLVNGIIAFMLTPGGWLESGSFWQGFFNDTFWPSLLFRTFICIMLAGLFGYVTSTWIKDTKIRCSMVRLCSLWTLVGFLFMLPCGWWYIKALPAAQSELMFDQSHRIHYFMQWFQYLAPVVFIGGLIMSFCMPRKVKLSGAVLLLILALGLTGSFEFIREAGRKPFVIWGYMYSNSVLVDKAAEMQGNSFFKHAKWAPEDLRQITDKNRMDAGRWLFQMQCASCHSIGGPLNDIKKRTSKYSPAGMDAFLSGMGKLSRYMPPFFGDKSERMALADYITEELNGYNHASPQGITQKDNAVQKAADGEYVLLAWPLQGMSIVSNDGMIQFASSQGNQLRAQLILKGDSPEVITDDVSLVCRVKGSANEYKMVAGDGYFESELIIYKSTTADGYDPLPVAEVEARDSDGKVIASTVTDVPATSRMNCYNCHGGKSFSETGGLADSTAMDILRTHDRDNRTDFCSLVEKGEQVKCSSCHNGKSQLGVSAALHGFHAVYLSGRSNDACTMCHPPESMRGFHTSVGLECVNCHGYIEDQAIALLKGEASVHSSGRFLKLLATSSDFNSAEEINPRQAWKQEPDCLTCHEDFSDPIAFSAFNVWNGDKAELYSNRKGDMSAIMCAACHDAPHAVFPSENELDNMGAIRLMGEAKPVGSGGTCTVCHENEMEYPAHHPGMGLE